MVSNFSIVQCIYNRGKYTPEEIRRILANAEQDESSAAKLLADDAVDVSPVRTAVLQAMGSDYIPACQHYSMHCLGSRVLDRRNEEISGYRYTVYYFFSDFDH